MDKEIWMILLKIVRNSKLKSDLNKKKRNR